MAQEKKGTSTGTSKSTEGKQSSKATIWNPAFVLNPGDPVISEASLRDAQKGKSGLVSKCLEKAFLLLEDMQELKGLRKCEVFLSFKTDLAKVSLYICTLLQFTRILYVGILTYVCMYNENRLCKHPSWPRSGLTMLCLNLGRQKQVCSIREGSD